MSVVTANDYLVISEHPLPDNDSNVPISYLAICFISALSNATATRSTEAFMRSQFFLFDVEILSTATVATLVSFFAPCTPSSLFSPLFPKPDSNGSRQFSKIRYGKAARALTNNSVSVGFLLQFVSSIFLCMVSFKSEIFELEKSQSLLSNLKIIFSIVHVPNILTIFLLI